jgi:hypothetical protein
MNQLSSSIVKEWNSTKEILRLLYNHAKGLFTRVFKVMTTTVIHAIKTYRSKKIVALFRRLVVV